MGRIQSSIGLMSGIPIADTVEALIALAARPRDMLVERTDTLQNEQLAVTELAALLSAVRYITQSLGTSDLYDQRDVSSSDPTVLSAELVGRPAMGTYLFTPLRMVRSQQWLGSGLAGDTDPLGGGKLTFRFGDHLQRSTGLEHLNGGEGVVRGKIRITDRSGARADVDLSTVQTIDDVLEAINGNPQINLTAVAWGDRIRLIDQTGQTVSNLQVQEIGSGSTAASLGLAGIDLAADVVDGEDRLWLYAELDLNFLNDGSGVGINSAMADIEFTLRDGTVGTIDFSPIETDTSNVLEDLTLGDLLERINSTAPGKLKAEIAADGHRLVLTDLSAGDGEFGLTPAFSSAALADLGLDGRESVAGVITGRRILGAARSVLVSSLNGGRGFGTLGALELTDRNGTTDTVDLSPAETLEEVIEIIAAADVGITVEVNRARNGIELRDTTGAYAGNLIVASADATGTAEKLGIAVDADVTEKNSGDLHLQVVAENTRLADLNGGAGVVKGTLTIHDSASRLSVLDLRRSELKTIGDVIREINRLAVDVYAEINETGDGIRIVDTAGGEASLQIEEGSTTTAADLHLLSTAEEIDLGGEMTQVIDGSTTYTIELSDEGSLEDLRQLINGLRAGVTAATFVDGSNRPFRLSLVSDRAGKAGELVVDTSEIAFSMEETARARDALLVFGEPEMAASSILVSSSSNTFRGVLSGVTLQIEQASDTPVAVTVGSTNADLLANVQTLVDNYNRFRERLQELTAYDAETDTRSTLTGDATALRLDTDLSKLLSGRFFGAGPIQSLAEVGLTLSDDGTLALDTAKLTDRFAEDPQAVERFFTTANLGLSEKLTELINSLAGEGASLLTHRMKALDEKIRDNQQRIDFMSDRLEVQRERLFMQFYRMEIAIGKVQSSLSAIEAIQPLAPIWRAEKI